MLAQFCKRFAPEGESHFAVEATRYGKTGASHMQPSAADRRPILCQLPAMVALCVAQMAIAAAEEEQGVADACEPHLLDPADEDQVVAAIIDVLGLAFE